MDWLLFIIGFILTWFLQWIFYKQQQKEEHDQEQIDYVLTQLSERLHRLFDETETSR